MGNSKKRKKVSSRKKTVKKTRTTTRIRKQPPKKKILHPGWVGLELNSRGDTEKDIEAMIALIRKNLGRPKIEVFVPVYYKSEEYFEKNVSFLDGYFFIKYEEGLPYNKLTETKYFQGVVTNPATKTPQIIPDEQVQRIQEKFQKSIKDKTKYKKGQEVRILDGLYKGLEGVIDKIIKEHELCIVSITSLKSRNIQASIPLVGIESKEGDETSRTPTFFGEGD